MRLRRLVRVWDEAVRIPGTGVRIGLDPVVGLVPGLGVALGGLVAGFVIHTAVLEGAPPALAGRLLLHLGVDATLGAIPVLGDVFDVGFRANRRNLALLERWLADPARTHATSRVVLVALVGTVLLIAGATLYAGYRLAHHAMTLVR
jgi:hypothetical protein